MKTHNLSQRPGLAHGTAFRRAGLAALLVLAVGFAVIQFLPIAVTEGDSETAGTNARSCSWDLYVHLGQWRADARTVAAMIRFIYEADLDLRTNCETTAQSIPTNSTLSCAGCPPGFDVPIKPRPAMDPIGPASPQRDRLM